MVEAWNIGVDSLPQPSEIEQIADPVLRMKMQIELGKAWALLSIAQKLDHAFINPEE